MSQANAAARKRRAFSNIPNGPSGIPGVVNPGQAQPGFNPNMPPQNKQAPPPSAPEGVPPGGLTMQQVFTLIDKRLSALESTTQKIGSSPINEIPSNKVPDSVMEIIVEFNNRFELIADEISNLRTDLGVIQAENKKIIHALIQLQGYNMEGTKSLIDQNLTRLAEINSTTNFDVLTTTEEEKQ
jgi:hypothetical protein